MSRATIYSGLSDTTLVYSYCSGNSIHSQKCPGVNDKVNGHHIYKSIALHAGYGYQKEC